MYEDILRQCHLKVTPARKEILHIMEDFDVPVTVEDVYEKLPKNSGISISTIYRNIKKLCDANILSKVAEFNNHVYYSFTNGKHPMQYFVVCNLCHHMQILDEKTLTHFIHKIERETKYHISDYIIEMRGICSKCKKRKP